VLGLSDREFFALTPRQYHLLLERHRESQKHLQWLTGVIASAIGNWSLGAPKEALQPRDFPLPLLHDGERKRRPRINRRKIADQIRGEFRRALERQKQKRGER